MVFSGNRFARKKGAICLAAVMLSVTLTGTEMAFATVQNESDDPGPAVDTRPALGINDYFGRWDKTVSLVYDPDDAPSLFTDADHVLELMQQAASEWEMVCGISFQIVGSDSQIPDDDDLPAAQQDGLVRVFWGTAGGAAGRAGPNFGSYDEDAGYLPYEDGDVELNWDESTWSGDDELVSTLVHELGHLIGLGHSDNSLSVMYANPYNFLRHPRSDDILAVQTLYGPPSSSFDVAAASSVWRYVPPSTFKADLITPNQLSDDAANISVGLGDDGEVVSELTDATPDSTRVVFNYYYGGNSFNSSVDLNVDAKLVIVDPFGYVHTETDTTLSCNARFSCGGGLNFISTDAMKSIPGDWKFYIVDEASDPDNPVTLLDMTFPVNTTVSANSSPRATVTVDGGVSQNSVNITLTPVDSDNTNLTVIWHPPGPALDLDKDLFIDRGIVDEIASGDAVNRDFSFPSSGKHTLFVEIRDDSVRYNSSEAGFSFAGDGYQTLIRIDVTFPITSDADIDVVSTLSSKETVNDVVLSDIALQNSLDGITALGAGASSAQLSAGASANGGVTVKNDFSVNDNVVIAGNIVPEAGDIGKEAEILIVIFDGNGQWTYRDLDGNFQPWNNKVTGLGAAYAIGSLSGNESFEIYRGILAGGNQRVFIGYVLTAGGPIHFNTKALKLSVQ